MMAAVNTITPNRRSYTVEGRVGELLVRGGKVRADVAERITGASVDLTVDQVSQMVFAFADPGLKVASTALFDAGTPSKAGSHIAYRDTKWECAALEVGDESGVPRLDVTARSLVSQRMRRQRGALVRRDLSPTEFVKLLASEAGAGFQGQPSAKRFQVARQKGESSWECAQRLAGELGYICFESVDTVHFAKPTWLVEKGKETLRIEWDADRDRAKDPRVLAMPRCRRSADDRRKFASVDVEVAGELGDDVRPGQALRLTGVPGFSGKYLITRVSIPLDDTASVTVSAQTPENPEKVTPAATGGGSGAGGDSGGDTGAPAPTGRGTASAFVAVALAQAGDTYIYGAEAAASNPNPTAFDCSELIQWACARVGVGFVDGSSAQIAACRAVSLETAINTRGALLWHPGHIAISLGNGRTIEAANSRVGVVSYPAAGRFQRGGLIPGLAY